MSAINQYQCHQWEWGWRCPKCHRTSVEVKWNARLQMNICWERLSLLEKIFIVIYIRPPPSSCMITTFEHINLSYQTVLKSSMLISNLKIKSGATVLCCFLFDLPLFDTHFISSPLCFLCGKGVGLGQRKHNNLFFQTELDMVQVPQQLEKCGRRPSVYKVSSSHAASCSASKQLQH